MKKFSKYFGEYLARLSPTVFIVSALTFIGYFALENFKIGLISNYFDLNKLLVICILSGLVASFYREQQVNGPVAALRAGMTVKHYLFALFFVILLGLFLAKYLAGYGKIGLLLAVCGAIALYTIIHLFYAGRGQN